MKWNKIKENKMKEDIRKEKKIKELDKIYIYISIKMIYNNFRWFF
jgi:hypothetical protein